MLLYLWSVLLDVNKAQLGTAILLPLLLPLFAILLRCGNMYRAQSCLRGLERINVMRSNMEDQFDSKYAISEQSPSEDPIRVKALFIHPVKSCGGVEVQRAVITKTGLFYDRVFAIAAEHEDPGDRSKLQWKFLSQRTKPAMSQIKAEIWLPKTNGSKSAGGGGGFAVLKFKNPDTPSWLDRAATIFYNINIGAVPEVTCVLPLQLPDPGTAQMRTFKIHGRDAKGLDMSYDPGVVAVLPKLRKFLGIRPDRGFSIMRCTPDTMVPTKRDLAPLAHIGTASSHGYTDSQPVNINSLSSVHAVSALLPVENQPLDALRFRANIWFSGRPAYDEESWKRCRFVCRDSGSQKQRCVSPCLSIVSRTSRCTMPNVNLRTGTFETDKPLANKSKGKPQPSATLVAHRMVENSSSALGYLGMQSVPEDRDLEEGASRGRDVCIEVGDEIEVIERGVHYEGSTANEY